MKKIILYIFIFFIFSYQTTFTNDDEIIKAQIEILKIKVEDNSPERIPVHMKKWNAKKILVQLGKGSVQPLIEIINDDYAKYYAIRALGEIGDETAIDNLSNILMDTTSTGRRYAAIALGRIKSKKAIPVLEKAMQDNDNTIKKDARVALEQINEASLR